MSKPIHMATICGILLTGCTSIHHYEHNIEAYEEINRKTKNKTVDIRLTSEQTTNGCFLRTAIDSTRWLESSTLSPTIVPTSDVRELYIKNRGRGAVVGFFSVAAVGAAASALVFLLAEMSEEERRYNDKTDLVHDVLRSMVVGVVVGIPLGAIVGAKDKFVLHK